MQGNQGNGAFKAILGGKTEVEDDLPEEQDEDVGRCASVPRGKWVRALTVKHAGRPWESFVYSYLGVRAEYEPGRFVVDFVAHDERYRLVVKGRNLEPIYQYCLQGRLEWMREVGPSRDFAPDGEPVITKLDTFKVEDAEPSPRRRGKQDDTERSAERGAG